MEGILCVGKKTTDKPVHASLPGHKQPYKQPCPWHEKKDPLIRPEQPNDEDPSEKAAASRFVLSFFVWGA